MRLIGRLSLGGYITLFLFASLSASGQVRVWQGTLTLPTYELGPADPNPSFPLVNSQNVYPYTMLDDLTNTRDSRVYKAIYLENDYLKLTILPQLGGHLYSIYDKVHHREVLYKNSVVKYGLIGPRGAWIAGGMEFSFPFAHTMDTVSPVESTLRHDADGGATAVIGAVDWVSSMHWEIALSLHPKTASVEEHVTLFNSTPQEHLYLFWTNTAIKATDDLQYIYPMRETISDDPYAVVQDWPTWNGIDQSWYKNVSGAMAIFGRDSHRNFFGAYYHQSDYGVAHVADFRQDPGKKIWSWGTARIGKIWDNILSDSDGPYNEIQSGRFPTQGFREFMEPRRVESWTEYWYPVNGLKDGILEATSKLAINATYITGPAGEPQVKLLVSPASDVSAATLSVSEGSTILREFHQIHFIPMQPASYIIPVRNLAEAQKNLEINIKSAEGTTLLHWSAAEPLDGNPDLVAKAGSTLQQEIPDSPQTPTEALYLRGTFLQKTGNMKGALKAYDDVLKRDPNYSPALIKEAWYRYNGGDFQSADALIARAANRSDNDPSVAYATGVICRAEGRLGLAKNGFWTSIHYGGPPAPAFLELGEIELREGHPAQAVELLKRAVSYNPDDAFALTDLAVAERLTGNGREAAVTVAEALKEMPLLPYALAEQSQDHKPSQPPRKKDSSLLQSWTKVIDSDPENYLAIAAWYHSIGAWSSSDAVLQMAQKNLLPSDLSPMVGYYLDSDARQEGKAQTATSYSGKTAVAFTSNVFPNRLEDVAVLTEALQQNPKDTQAQYSLGNFLFAHGRYEEAADLWQKALSGGLDHPVLLRNLGVFEWHVKGNLASAASYFAWAIKLNPEEYRLYQNLDEIYEEQNDAGARTALFRNAPPSVLDRDTILARRALVFIEQSQYDQALALLMHHRFKPWEGGVVIHNMFVFANMAKGEQELANHHPEEAAEAFHQAMLYPEDLGTGQPDQPDIAEQLFWLGNALQDQGKHAEAVSTWTRSAAQGKGTTTVSAVYSALASKKLGQGAVSHQLLGDIVAPAMQPNASAADCYAAGTAQRYSGHPELASRDYSRALQLDPRFWQARVALDNITKPGARPGTF